MSSLEAVLTREIALISRFLSALAAEQTALKNATPDALPEIHQIKSTLVDELNATEAERIKLIGVTNGMSDRQNMDAWLARHPDEKTLAAQWRELIALARQARHESELNANLVRLHLEKTTQALTILTRHAHDNALYGSNGQAAVHTGSRILDSA